MLIYANCLLAILTAIKDKEHENEIRRISTKKWEKLISIYFLTFGGTDIIIIYFDSFSYFQNIFNFKFKKKKKVNRNFCWIEVNHIININHSRPKQKNTIWKRKWDIYGEHSILFLFGFYLFQYSWFINSFSSVYYYPTWGGCMPKYHHYMEIKLSFC